MSTTELTGAQKRLTKSQKGSMGLIRASWDSPRIGRKIFGANWGSKGIKQVH